LMGCVETAPKSLKRTKIPLSANKPRTVEPTEHVRQM
jgi:hypothetical protein